MPDEAPWTVGRLLSWTTDYLASRGGARIDAEVLLAHALGCERIQLYTRYEDVPQDTPRAAFKDLVRRRAGGEPVAYLVGRKEFYSLELAVRPGVLVPRPETELLVLKLLDRLTERGLETPRVADVGTGSGAIAVAIATQAPGAVVTAVDTSDAALAVARENAERHGVADRVRLVKSDLFAAVAADERFDAIASNPPYVTTNELMNLEPTVRDHEPHAALDGGPDGTSVIARLLPQAAERLDPGGDLLIEIGPAIADRVEALVKATDGLAHAATHNDLADLPRVVHATS